MNTGSIEKGVRRYKQVYIIDLSDISVGSLIARPLVREMTTAIMGAANTYCPETMWKCFVVNAPFIFRSVYSMLSPFIHPVTKEKIKILGGPSKYIPEMAANGIPKSAIPKFLGGDCKQPASRPSFRIPDRRRPACPRSHQATQRALKHEEEEEEPSTTPHIQPRRYLRRFF